MKYINEGVWIIMFTNKRFWIGSSKNIQHHLTSRLSQANKECYSTRYTQLPDNVKAILKKEGYVAIQNIYAITSDIYENDILKFLMSKALINNGYEPCVESHKLWMEKHSNWDFEYSSFIKYAVSNVKAFKARASLEYEICKDFNWILNMNFLIDLLKPEKSMPSFDLKLQEIKKEQAIKNPKRAELSKLLAIESILRDMTKEELIKSLISDKAYEIYKITQ